MATSIPLPEKMDLKTLSHVVSLRQKNGLHIDYQYGLMTAGYEWRFEWPDPMYNGCSLRVFIYNRVNELHIVRMAWFRDVFNYFAAVQVQDSDFSSSYGNGSRKDGPTNPTGQIALGTFFSLGLRIARDLIYPMVNDWVGHGFNIGKQIANERWMVEISTRNYMVSLHLCDEVGGSFPSGGLNQSYGLSGLSLPIGSYVTVFAVYTGGSPLDPAIWIKIALGNGRYWQQPYHYTPLNLDEEFCITASNTIEGWLLETSFLDDTQTAILRTSSDVEKNTRLSVSRNCYIRRILAVSGPIPPDYRPQ